MRSVSRLGWPTGVLVIASAALALAQSASLPKDLDADSRAWLASGAPRLFDLEADPDENESVAADHPDVVARLARAIDAWWTP